MPQKPSYNWKKIYLNFGRANKFQTKAQKSSRKVYLGKLLTCMGDQEICAVSIMQQILRTWPTDFHWFRILFWNLFCLVYIKICLFVLFAYKYLRINFYPLVCCCVKPLMQARKNRRHTAEDSDKKGNFCSSKTGLLIAESGNMVSGTCNFGHVLFLDTGYNIDVLKNIQVDCVWRWEGVMEAERFENHDDPGRGNCQPYNFVWLHWSGLLSVCQEMSTIKRPVEK